MAQGTGQFANQRLKDAFAINERAAPQIATIEVEEIEGEEREALRPAGAEIAFQGPEIRQARGREDHDLAIDDGAVDGQLPERALKGLEPVRPVVPAARKQSGLPFQQMDTD